ncbi:BrnT family toxin [Sulfurimonas sp.]|uniref:BrnT family toxin n=1 Tax=Sulfurimonas sp. TaxID=2022749 RepID=UPI003918E3E6
MHISIYDEEHSSEEDRWVTVGMDLKTRTLVVVHTFITVNKKNCNIRIISARKATKNERNFYTKG